MSIPTESDSDNPLYCELCNFVSFNSYVEFDVHHLKHIRQPLVRLVKLSPSLYAKLQKKSYEVNTGVARRSIQFEHVPPLKISLVNQQGCKQFQVINKERTSNSSNFLSSDNCGGSNHREETKAKVTFKGNNTLLETEGTNLLERFGASISVSRKSKSMPQTLCKATLENSDGNGKKEAEISQSVVESKKDPLLERLSGIGGISISKSKSSSNGILDTKTSFQNSSSKQSQISISTKEKSIDLNQLIKLKDQEEENDKKAFDRNKILEKLSGSGLICIAPKCPSRSDNEKTEGAEITSTENADSTCNKSPRGRLDRLSSSKSEDSNDSENSKTVNVDQTNVVKSNEEDKTKVLNGNISESGGQKRFVRVKNSTFSKKNIQKQNSADESFTEEKLGPLKDCKENCLKETGRDTMERLIEEKTGSPDDSKENCSKESGRDILERLTDNLSNAVAAEKTDRSAEVENSDVSKLQGMEGSPLLSANSGGGDEHPELSDKNLVSSYQNDQPQKDPLVTSNNLDSNDQLQQDSLMTPDNTLPNGGEINPNFLQNFLDEHHPPNSLQPDNSEFMSLDGLAQTQHHLAGNVGASYDLNNSETNTPMEQLSQQVQRMSNPINVIPQHHMQAPQPPQLHTGVPISPQHISPQQPNSYEALSHMQPPMPPPMYQGFNMFNQNYQPQTPQMPRPPMLQQRPQIQPRPFQSLAAPPRQRSRVTKRPMVRIPSTQEMMMPKQRRMDPPLQARPQIQNATAKLPSGITVTPPRKAVEANKAANVLASRGITVTPSVSRQKNSLPAPLLNIGSGISITSSSQNKNNGGFAVPARKCNAPIVNNNLERPERCSTVDLTQDDEPSHGARNKMGRFSCKICQKIFTSSMALESHKAFHRTPTSALPFKCDKCSAEYSASAYLERHKYTFHKSKQAGPDLAIPIVDLNFPGAKDQLLKCGVSNFIPLSQLQSNNNGYFGLPIIQLDMTKEKAMSNLSALGAGNVFVLGKMKALAPCINH